jgi:hypothetical protein
MTTNYFLIAGSGLSAIAALLHIGIIIKGARWYRLFGAGEQFAQAAEQGKAWPHAITLVIALVLFSWAAYALSGAGLLPMLPLLKPALYAITAIYLLRGLALFPAYLFARSKVTPFILWSSIVCMLYGVVHLIGVVNLGKPL